MREELFNEIIETFENEDLKVFFAEKCLPIIPKYFWEVPASSSLKYHPAYACTTPLGLAKHTVALVRILNHMFGVESVANQFSSRERDLLRIAGLMHDTYKSGNQEDYEKNKYTKFDHPLRAADAISKLGGIAPSELDLICHAIISHMGAFNTDKRNPDIVLPKPDDKYQIILHLADYLASRKDIELKFDLPESDNKLAQKEQADLNTWIVPFGKHKGKTMREIYSEDPGYVHWAADKATHEPFHTFAVQIIENK